MAPILPMFRDESLRAAARELAEGGLVAFATDTVYGVGALPSPRSARRVFEAKGRPGDKPLPLLLAGAALLDKYSVHVPAAARALADAYWPGPVTIVVQGRPAASKAVGSRDGGIGVRVPNHEPLLRLLAACGGALAVSSANRSGEPEALSAGEVEEQLGAHVALILDGGPSRNPIPSTVVDVRPAEPVILRSGLVEGGVRAALAAARIAAGETH